MHVRVGGLCLALLTIALAAAFQPAQRTSMGTRGAPSVPVFEHAAAGLRFEFDQRGLRVQHGDPDQDPQWTRIATTSFGHASRPRPISRGALTTSGDRATLALGPLQEWVCAVPRGIEQGWTVPAPPDADVVEDLWIGLSFEGPLSVRVVDDGRGAFLSDSSGQPRLLYSALLAHDASGRILAAKLQASSHGIGIRVACRGAVYPVTVDPLVTPAGWSFETDQDLAGAPPYNPNNLTLALFLQAATAGDVNGDGFSDVIVGAAGYDGMFQDEGRVWVFHGSSTGPSPVANWHADGNAASRYLGRRVACAGDVNSDSYDDIVVAADSDVYVWLGGPGGLGATGTPSNADFTLMGVPATAVATCGDLNGDGFDDFAVGASGSGSNGQVYVCWGGPAGPLSQAAPLDQAWMRDSPDTDVVGTRHFGWSLAGAGDVNWDGFDDLVVGAPDQDSSGGQDAGRVYVYHGGGLFHTHAATADTVLDGGPSAGATNARFGNSVSPAGDVNGDGYADILVGAPQFSGSSQDAGKVELFLGGAGGVATSPGAVVSSFPATYAKAGLGFSVATAGDVNGDGFADVVLGRPDFTPQWPIGAGAILLAHGHPGAGLSSTVHLGPPGSTDAFGFVVAGAGDVDGDGLTDVLVVSPFHDGGHTDEGRVELFYGARNPSPVVAAATLPALPAGAEQGAAVSASGDVNGDGYGDLLVGSPGYVLGGAEGRADLYLGSASGYSSVAQWSSLGSGSPGQRYGHSVALLDVNNDGFSDVVIGAAFYSNGEVGEGRLTLHLGNASGMPSSVPAWAYESDSVGAQLGSAIAAAGDMDGDGFADLVAGAPGFASAGPDQGRVLAFRGESAGFSASPYWTNTGPSAGSRYGASLAAGGDVNGDRFSDVAIGAPRLSNGQTDEGGVFLFLGSATGLNSTPNWSLESNQPGARLGTGLAMGDFNADGLTDVAIGLPGLNAASSGGAIFVHSGSSGMPLAMPFVAQRDGPGPNAEFGSVLAAAGDLRASGFVDLAVGAPEFSGGSGSVHLFLGDSAWIGTTADQVLMFGAGARGGAALAGSVDANGDGRGDFVVGQPGTGSGGGSIGIYHGGSVSPGLSFRTAQRQHADLSAIQLLGRTESGTEYRLRMFSSNAGGMTSTAMGPELVRLQYESKLLQGALDGTALVAQPTWTSSFNGVFPLSVLVPGLQLDEAYHWRARMLVRNPFLPHTRWMSLAGNGRQEAKLGTGFDCNNNDIPDSIELQTGQALDCNANLVPDECDISSGFSQDCNNNGSPDECDLFANDCNNDQIPDECQLGANDCNSNFTPDDCDVASGASADSNADGIPDECQPGSTTFCAGDGSGTSCPCGNNSAPGGQDGCLNSLGLAGRLRSTGVARVAFDSLTLLGSAMANSSVLYFQGTGQQNGGLGSVFGDGLRCASGSVIRLGTKINSAGASHYPGASDPSISVRGLLPAAGGTRQYQAWYRNAATFCTASTFNLTNGLRVVWIP